MKIAILSDIHDNIWNLEKVIFEIRGTMEAVIFCGDFCAPFSASLLGSLDVPIYACFGNNDEDQIGIYKRGGSQYQDFVALTEEFGVVEFDHKKIAFCHYPKLGELLAHTHDYDAVFHGHTHKQYSTQVEKTLLANPGSVCGIVDGKPGEAHYGIYNTETNEIEIITLK